MHAYSPASDQFTPARCDIAFNRLGYGAMQLAGPHVWGPPKDRAAAVAVLREAIELGVNHIDTSDFYGPHVTNQIIREALHPYRDGLSIVTKIGFVRGADQSWLPAASPQQLRDAVHDNLRNLGLDVLVLRRTTPTHPDIPHHPASDTAPAHSPTESPRQSPDQTAHHPWADPPAPDSR